MPRALAADGLAGRDEKSLQFYARLAGFLYLFILAAYDLSDYFLVSHAVVAGNFTQTAHNIAGSETLYRLGLAGEFVASWLTVALAGALYVTLKSVDANLSLLALLFRVAEAAVGSVCALISFIKLRLYVGAGTGTGVKDAPALVELLSRTYGACFQMTVIFFSVGSILFFWLLLKSRFIPRLLSGFGIFASCLVTVLGFINLIVPRYSALLAPGWFPILIAEVATGLWLLIRGVNTTHWRKQAAFPTQ